MAFFLRGLESREARESQRPVCIQHSDFLYYIERLWPNLAEIRHILRARPSIKKSTFYRFLSIFGPKNQQNFCKILQKFTKIYKKLQKILQKFAKNFCRKNLQIFFTNNFASIQPLFEPELPPQAWRCPIFWPARGEQATFRSPSQLAEGRKIFHF